MKDLFRVVVVTLILLIGSVATQAQPCNYGYGQINGYEPYYYNSYTIGETMPCSWYVPYPYGASTISVDISTDAGGNWTEVATNQTYYYSGSCTVTIPWTLSPSSQCIVRYREVPSYKGDCAYNYDGYNYYNYSYWYGYYFTINPGCYTPIITTQPLDQTGCAGFSATINIGVDIGPAVANPKMSYEWYKGATLFATTASPSYTFSNVTANDAGTYKMRAKNACGKQVDSKTFNFTVNTPAVITQQPVGITICPNQDGTLTVAGTGTTLKYQWYKNGVVIAGATNNTFVIKGAQSTDGAKYRATVVAACGPTLTSTEVTVVVPPSPVITGHPASGGYCIGTDVVLNAAVSGSGFTYQWFKDEMLITGATTTSLTLSSIQTTNTGSYWLKVTGNASGCVITANTQPAYVFTYPTPKITAQPKPIDLCVGARGELIVSAEGSDLRYQWYRNGAPVPNATSYSLVLTGGANVGGTYSVDVRSACNGFIKSENAVVTVVSTPKITVHPQPQNLNVGEALMLSVAASDARKITWLRNEQVVAVGTDATYIVPGVSMADGGYYRAIVENVCGSSTSKSALVMVTDPATLVPLMQITSEELNLGDVPFGYERERTFDNLVVNLGAAPLNVTATSISGMDASAFTIVSGGAPFTLAPGEQRTVQVRFRPSHLGTSSSSLDFTSNAAPGSASVPVHGNGVIHYTTATMLSFGNVRIPESKDDCLTLTNTSSVDIVIDQVNLGGPNAGDFAVTTATPLSIGAGQTAQVCFKFTPSSEGSRSATIAFMSSTGGNTNSGAQGTGEPAVGVIEDAREAGMTIYPNPTTGSVTINTGAAIAKSISFINVTGLTVATINPTAPIVQWDCKTSNGSAVPSGTYNVLVNTDAGSYTMTLSIVR